MRIDISAHLGELEGAPTGPGTTPAAFWSARADLEGAAIIAFEVLASELACHGAPPDLVARVHAASDDERRHFQLTSELAQRHGAPPPAPPAAARPAQRTLERLARENAAEGCVGESFSATLALWQSATAATADVRTAMARIATDELAHAQLARDVDRWAREKLGTAGARALDQVRAHAAHQLVRQSRAPVDRWLVMAAGLPDGPTTHQLALQACSSLRAA